MAARLPRHSTASDLPGADPAAIGTPLLAISKEGRALWPPGYHGTQPQAIPGADPAAIGTPLLAVPRIFREISELPDVDRDLLFGTVASVGHDQNMASGFKKRGVTADLQGIAAPACEFRQIGEKFQLATTPWQFGIEQEDRAVSWTFDRQGDMGFVGIRQHQFATPEILRAFEPLPVFCRRQLRVFHRHRSPPPSRSVSGLPSYSTRRRRIFSECPERIAKPYLPVRTSIVTFRIPSGAEGHVGRVSCERGPSHDERSVLLRKLPKDLSSAGSRNFRPTLRR